MNDTYFVIVDTTTNKYWSRGRWVDKLKDAHFYGTRYSAEKTTIDPRLNTLHYNILKAKIIVEN